MYKGSCTPCLKYCVICLALCQPDASFRSKLRCQITASINSVLRTSSCFFRCFVSAVVAVCLDYGLTGLWAVWHGQHTSNEADEMFAAVINSLYSRLPSANRKFVTHKNLYQVAYCSKSGMAISPNCTTIDTGYFESQDALPVCDTCSKP